MPHCNIIIKDEVNVKLEGLDLVTRRKLTNKFKYEIPGARFMPAVRLGRWDGTVSFFSQGGLTYVNLLEDIDAFRRPHRLAQVLAVCEADYKGRTGHADSNYRQKEIVERNFAAANAVNTTAIASRFDDGQKISDSIRQARCAAIRATTPVAQSDPS